MSISAHTSSSSAGREFPTLGSVDHPVTSTTRARLFVTGPVTRTSAWSTGKLMRSVHAKAMGSISTLCGLPTASWATLWEVPFVAARFQGACPTCRMLSD